MYMTSVIDPIHPASLLYNNEMQSSSLYDNRMGMIKEASRLLPHFTTTIKNPKAVVGKPASQFMEYQNLQKMTATTTTTTSSGSSFLPPCRDNSLFPQAPTAFSYHLGQQRYPQIIPSPAPSTTLLQQQQHHHHHFHTLANGGDIYASSGYSSQNNHTEHQVQQHQTQAQAQPQQQ
jgi:hypothetical protein